MVLYPHSGADLTLGRVTLMKVSPLICCLVLWSALAFSAPLIFTDPYCGALPVPGCGSPDVIGSPSFFDINMASFDFVDGPGDFNALTIVIEYNYHGGDASLSPFSLGAGQPTLHVGDLLFRVGGVWKYALVLNDLNDDPLHDAFEPGKLYQITGAWKASEVLSPLPSGNYRPNEYVWAKEAGAVEVSTATLSTVAAIGAKLVTTAIDANVPQAIFEELQTAEFQFASATCGNDVLSDGLGIPEPATLLLLGGGLIALGLFPLSKP